MRLWACTIVLSSLASWIPIASQAKSVEIKKPKSKKDQANTSDDAVSLNRKVDILTEEVQKLRSQLVIPDKETYKSVYGLGPAASRVYLLKRGLSVGGYGEYYLERKVKDKAQGQFNTGDTLRYIQYLGYKFSDKLVMNAEIEFEHATTGSNYMDRSGSISVEFAYMDYLAHPAINVRFGLLLIPVGYINEIHEPPFFHGVFRPAVEQAIIPSTWRELGLGIFGEPVPGFTYKLYMVTGFNGENFSPSGWRSGRQNGNRVLSEDYAVVGRLDYKLGDIFNVGASFYYGSVDQNRVAGVESSAMLFEGHAQVRYKGFEFRFLGAFGSLSGARALTQGIFPDSTDPTAPETRLIGSQVYGWYAELAYDLWPLWSQKNLYLAPYFRFERYNTQFEVPDFAGRTADPSQAVSILETGVSFKPHPQVVIKLSYRDTSNDGTGTNADQLLVGAGFIY